MGVYQNATAANAVFTITTEATLFIADEATADHAVVTCIGGDEFIGAAVEIQQFSSAGEGHFTAVGASSSGEKGGYIDLTGSATAANGTFVINGGMGGGPGRYVLTFFDTTTAAAANITANGGVGGAEGGAIFFEKKSKGGTAWYHASRQCRVGHQQAHNQRCHYRLALRRRFVFSAPTP